MVKLRLKRCGRKQRATWRIWSAVDSYIHHFFYINYIGMRVLLARHRLFCSTRKTSFFEGCDVNSTWSWWSSSKKYWFIF